MKLSKCIAWLLIFVIGFLAIGVLGLAAEEALEVTIPEAHAIARDADGKQYIVRGAVKVIEDPAIGKLYIEDASGNTLCIYGLYSADGSAGYDAMEVKLNVGDILVLQGELTTYNGEAQMKNACVLSHAVQDHVTPTAPPPTTSAAEQPLALTIAQANEIAGEMEEGSYTQQAYLVSGVVCKIVDAACGDIYIQDASGNQLRVGSLVDADGTVYADMSFEPNLGDTVTLLGELGIQQGQPRMKCGVVVEHIPAGPAPTGTVWTKGVRYLLVLWIPLVFRFCKKKNNA